MQYDELLRRPGGDGAVRLAAIRAGRGWDALRAGAQRVPVHCTGLAGRADRSGLWAHCWQADCQGLGLVTFYHVI
jgi:hypothetical protein